ncbi:MAG: alpha/beta hydrolase [Pseudomonadota bacterium]
MPSSRKLYVDGEFGQIHLRMAGEKSSRPPLVCLHQSPKNSLEFEIFLHHAAKDRLVIAPDYPGYGMSDPPSSQEQATIHAYARNMWRVVDTFSLKRIDLFGNHTGGIVAIEMARQQPERIRGIAMVTAALLTEDERTNYLEYFRPIPLDHEGTRHRVNWARIIENADSEWPLDLQNRSFLQTCMAGEAYEWGHYAAFTYPHFEEGLRTLPHHKIILNPDDMLQGPTRRAREVVRNGEIIECPQWGFGLLDIHAPEIAALVTSRLDALP